MRKNFLFKASLLVGIIGTVLVNMLAVLLPLNNRSTASISDSFQVYFVPAGYVFAIWGVIYVLLLGFGFYQARMKNKDYAVVRKIAPYVLLSCFNNGLWLFCWHFGSFYLSLVVMLLLFVCLLEIYLILRKTKTADQPKYFRWLIKIPFSIYIGWITVATVANATDVLSLAGSGNGILGIAPLIWAALMIMVSGLLGILMLLREKDYAYAAVIIWAVVGIAVKFPSENWIVCAVTLVVLAFVVAGLYPKLKEG
jgi:hypothetical protein